jgi:hypothetical protein
MVSSSSKESAIEFTVGKVKTVDGEIRQMELFEAQTRIE